MTQIEIGSNRVEVDAELVAAALKIHAAALKQGMRDGKITSRFERGEDSDEGKVRLAFFSARRRVCMTADESGKILTSSAANFGDGPLREIAQ